ncbi:hypothetical protein BC941DRAFT_422852 [Chlamydoabsidia padenii]|nr:hypothetical protein BC941DRAFT_422852 [Chlamydoabsidia padenii]
MVFSWLGSLYWLYPTRSKLTGCLVLPIFLVYPTLVSVNSYFWQQRQQSSYTLY